MSPEKKKFPWATFTWGSIALASLELWHFESQGSGQRGVLIVGLSLASFMLGCLIGFVFTSYGDEVGTVGKVRDWLIGGIAGLTIGKAEAVKGLLDKFNVGPANNDFPLMASLAIFYIGLGFFFMFFQRELILNVDLAQKRSERLRLEGSREAGQVIQRFLLRLPASLLSGVENIDEIREVKGEEAKMLEQMVTSDDVKNFLQEAENASKNGSLDWDIASKTAYIHYYRTYFQKVEADKRAEVGKALEWITRALSMNPLHVDLTIKLADMLDANGEYEAAVAILERLELRPEAPVLVKHLLGYALLYLSGRGADSLRYSEEYLKYFPGDKDTPFNIACAFAQMYCEELRSKHKSIDLESNSRKKALEYLEEALRRDPDYANIVKSELTEKGEDFDCFASDPDFKRIVDDLDPLSSQTDPPSAQ